MKNPDLHTLYHQGFISNLDVGFAGLMERLSHKPSAALGLGAALVSHSTREGHICLDLSTLAGNFLRKDEDDQSVCPDLNDWRGSLRESDVVGEPGEYKPLILDDRSRLYLFRYWDYQEKLADSIRRRVGERAKDVHEGSLKEGLNRLFADEQANGINWQKVAAFVALSRGFCVISGGPGTGKTTTVAKILALLVEQTNRERVRIALAAPTGKAAVRLQETVKRAKEKLNCPASVREAVPEDASTLHRLLGSVPGTPYFRHDAQNRLPARIVVVDEASMVDLPLMSKLIQALSPEAGLILLGDKDQLASVEAGAVLGDICDTGRTHGFSRRFCGDLERLTGYKIGQGQSEPGESGIRDCIVRLRKGYRFGSGSGIGAVSRAVNEGEADLALAHATEGDYPDIEWRDLPRSDALPRMIKEPLLGGFREYLRSNEPGRALESFDRFRVLCALREGPYGVHAINLLAEEILEREGLIRPESKWYAGQPVLITRNDYRLQLYNGDVGIILPDPEANGDLRAFFAAPEGRPRRFHPVRLPQHETVFAMTVHKSQGSEFDRVLLLLPDRDAPVLTRELIYTGLTRARAGIQVWGTRNIFRNAVSRRIERMSGLRDALWEGG